MNGLLKYPSFFAYYPPFRYWNYSFIPPPIISWIFLYIKHGICHIPAKRRNGAVKESSFPYFTLKPFYQEFPELSRLKSMEFPCYIFGKQQNKYIFIFSVIRIVRLEPNRIKTYVNNSISPLFEKFGEYDNYIFLGIQRTWVMGEIIRWRWIVFFIQYFNT